MKRPLKRKGPGLPAGAGNLEAAAIKHSDPLDRLFGRQTQFLIDPHPIGPFPHHRPAALTLLSECPDLSHKAAGFLGHVCVAHVLSDKQRDWLIKLLDRADLPTLAERGAHV